MPVYKINIKWQKDKFCDIECNTDESPEIFKALLFSLSGVAPDRQTIMFPGGTLKDTWSNIKIKDGMTVMMMGSSEKIIEKISEVERPKFIEDMTEGQIQKELKVPQGLQNIGNTCYLNATLQCFRSIPELFSIMKCVKKHSTPNGDPINSLVFNITNLFNNMDTTTQPLNPFLVLKSLHTVCPQFATTQEIPAERGGGSVLMQQDANECFTELIRCFQRTLVMPANIENCDLPESFKGSEGGWNFVEKFLSGSFEVKTVNTEIENDVVITEEPFLELSCFVESGLKYLHTGLRKGMESNLTKMCESLGKDVVYKRTSLISRLPAYLSIQFVRFYYKEKEKINAKILKDIKFQMILDMFEFCTPELQKKLITMRDKYKIMDEFNLKKEREIKGKELKEVVKEKESAANHYPYWFDDDIGSNNSGMYELRAVVTHQGRSSKSGHYVGWVRKETSSDDWLKYDDDAVSFVKSDDILRLSGGGDWHCAYVLIYGPVLINKICDSTSNNVEMMDTSNVTNTTTAKATTTNPDGEHSNSNNDKMQ